MRKEKAIMNIECSMSNVEVEMPRCLSENFLMIANIVK
jgi:hypothetical protein